MSIIYNFAGRYSEKAFDLTLLRSSSAVQKRVRDEKRERERIVSLKRKKSFSPLSFPSTTLRDRSPEINSPVIRLASSAMLYPKRLDGSSPSLKNSARLRLKRRNAEKKGKRGKSQLSRTLRKKLRLTSFSSGYNSQTFTHIKTAQEPPRPML